MILVAFVLALAFFPLSSFAAVAATDGSQVMGEPQNGVQHSAKLANTGSQSGELQNLKVDSDGVMTWDPDPAAKCYQCFCVNGLARSGLFTGPGFQLNRWLDQELEDGNAWLSSEYDIKVIAYNRDLISDGSVEYSSVDSIPSDIIAASGQLSYSYLELNRCENVNLDNDGLLTWLIDGQKYYVDFGMIFVDGGEPHKVKPISGKKRFSFSANLKSLIDEEVATGRKSVRHHEIRILLYNRSEEDESGESFQDILMAQWIGSYDYLSPYTGTKPGTVKNVKVNSNQQISWDAYKKAASYDITITNSKTKESHTYATSKRSKNKIVIPDYVAGIWSSKTININIKITARNKDGITIAYSKPISHKYKKKELNAIKIATDVSSVAERGKKIKLLKFADKSSPFKFQSTAGVWWKKSGNKWVRKDNSGKFTTGEWKYKGWMYSYGNHTSWIYTHLSDDVKLYVGGAKWNHKSIELDNEFEDYNFGFTFESPVIRIGSSPKTLIKKVDGTKRGFKVTWKKTAKTAGYQVRYSVKSNFTSSVHTKSFKKKTTSATIKKLKKGKRYYVQVRTFTLKNGKKYYSPWSAKKSVKTK